jgi:hypothetical protein
LHAGTFKSIDGLRHLKGVEKGTPDWAFVHGIFPAILVECKRPGEQPAPEQLLKIFELRKAYGLAIVVVDSGLMLEAWLDDHEERARKRWKQFLSGP